MYECSFQFDTKLLGFFLSCRIVTLCCAPRTQKVVLLRSIGAETNLRHEITGLIQIKVTGLITFLVY